MNTEKRKEIIFNVVCKTTGVTEEQIKSKTRIGLIAKARHLCAYFMNKYTNLSYRKIALDLNLKDHSTICHSIKTVNNLVETEPDFAEIVNSIKIILDSQINNKTAIESKVSPYVFPGLKPEIKLKKYNIVSYSVFRRSILHIIDSDTRLFYTPKQMRKLYGSYIETQKVKNTAINVQEWYEFYGKSI